MWSILSESQFILKEVQAENKEAAVLVLGHGFVLRMVQFGFQPLILCLKLIQLLSEQFNVSGLLFNHMGGIVVIGDHWYLRFVGMVFCFFDFMYDFILFLTYFLQYAL